MLIESKTDAIKYLNQHGYRAKERDWVLGQTIVVPIGQQEETQIGNQALIAAEGMLCIYPSGDKWAINDFNNMGEEEDKIYESLQDAVMNAENIASNYSTIQAKRHELRKERTKNYLATLKPLDPAELLRSSADMVSWDTSHPKEGKFLFHSEDEMQKVWIEQGGVESKMPKIDFAEKMVVAIFMDEGTYKYAFGIRSVKNEANGIKVLYTKNEMAWNVINPCSVYEINRAEGDVEFIQINH